MVKSSLKAVISHVEKENLNETRNEDEADATMEVDKLKNSAGMFVRKLQMIYIGSVVR